MLHMSSPVYRVQARSASTLFLRDAEEPSVEPLPRLSRPSLQSRQGDLPCCPSTPARLLHECSKSYHLLKVCW